MNTMRISNALAAIAALAVLVLPPSQADAANLRFSPALDADPAVTWTEGLGGLDLRVDVPPFDPENPAIEGYGSFDLSGLRDVDERLRELPPLPVRWVRLPIPAEGELALEVFELRFADGSVRSLTAGEHRHGRHRLPILEGELAPEQPLSIDGVGIDGLQRFAYLRVMPLLRSLDGGDDLSLVSARARLHVGAGVGPIASNPEEGVGFSRRNRELPSGDEPAAAPTLAPRARILVTEPGLQVLTRAALEAVAPELLEVSPQQLRLMRDGREVSRAILLDAAGELAGLEFVGSPRIGESETGVFQAGDFTDTEVFFLEAAPAGEAGRDFASSDATPSGSREMLATLAEVARLEENSYFYNTVATADFDHWAWGPQLQSDGSVPATLAVPLDLPGLDVDGDDAVSLRVTWHGRRQDDVGRPHRTELLLGGTSIDSADWEGFRVFVQRADASASAVAAAGDLLVSVPGLPGTGMDGVSLDHVLVGYRRLPVAIDDLLDARIPDGQRRLRVSGFSDPGSVRVFDLADRDAPAELLGGTPDGDAILLDVDGGRLGRILRLVGPDAVRTPEVQRSAPADLLAPATGADWLAILPESLDDSTRLPDLVNARLAGGWLPRVVALQDAFDLFSFGRPDPRAVPRLLEHALINWPDPKPEVVVLLGDGSQDYKGTQDAGASVLPAQLFTDPSEHEVIGHHAGDSRAGAVLGEDLLPEAAMGRIPARVTAELDAAFAKILANEAPEDGAWRSRAVFVADNRRASDGFAALADALAAATPAPHSVRRVHGTELIVHDFDGVLAEEGGAAVVLYAGHGAIDRWSPHGGFRTPYLEADDVSMLQPGGPWPVFVDGGSLLTGAYHHEADVPSLQEALLLGLDSGSAGGIAPSGDLSHEHGLAVTAAAHEALYGLDRVRTLGELAERVRRSLDQVGGPRSPQAVAGLVVFGDPAMPLALPVPPRPPWLTADGEDASILLTWAAPPSAPANALYRVYRADEPAGPYAVLADGVDATTLDDAAVEIDRTYHYRVALLDEAGFESPASNRAHGRVGEEAVVRVDGCIPDAGPIAGGQVLRIIGRGFQPGALGFLRGEPCDRSTWISPEALECVSPAAAHPGLADAAVVNPDTSRGERARAYIYCPDRGLGLSPTPMEPTPILVTRQQVEAFAAGGETLIFIEDTEPRSPRPIGRRPDDPRPDSFEPVIDPDLQRIIRFPKPDCRN
jgi:hypothetical protein